MSKTVTLVTIRTDGTFNTVRGVGRLDIKSIQDEVGGDIEQVQVPSDIDVIAYCDDEGKLKGLAQNLAVMALTAYPIYGPVVVVCKNEDEADYCYAMALQYQSWLKAQAAAALQREAAALRKQATKARR